MRARLYRPARNVMQSGTARTRHWILEFAPDEPRGIDPLMGWTSAADTQAQVRMRFDTAEQAMDYAREQGLDVQVAPPHRRGVNIRTRGYGENFSTDRRIPWTH